MVQDPPLGTGHAVKAAAAHLDTDAPVVVLNGDVPLIASDTIALLAGMQARDPDRRRGPHRRAR